MRFLKFLALTVLSCALSSEALAVGECDDHAFGGGASTPCCSNTSMAAGGTCYVPADTKFQFTIRTIGFEKSDGTVVTLGNNKEFDASAADAGNVIGNFISGSSLPAGTYVAVRASVSLLATTANTAVTTLDNRTCSSGTVTGQFEQPMGGFPTCGAGEPNAAVDSCIDAADPTLFKYRNTQIGTLAYDGTSSLSVAFTFKTGNGVNCTFAAGSGGTETSKTPGLLNVQVSRN